jgi:hypothetical protein
MRFRETVGGSLDTLWIGPSWTRRMSGMQEKLR